MGLQELSGGLVPRVEPDKRGSAVVRRPYSVVLLVRRLSLGGAERQAVTLARGLREKGLPVSVLIFYSGGLLEGELRELEGVEWVPLRKRGRWDLARFFIRLMREVRKRRPCVVLSYLTVPNIAAALCRISVPGLKIVWGVRNSTRDNDLKACDWSALWCARLERALARLPDAVVFNSYAGLQAYRAERMVLRSPRVIPNGIDTDRFRPCAEDRDRMRAELGISRDEFLVGAVGRIDPMKDYGTFLRAAGIVRKARPEIRFLCVGDPAPGREALLGELSTLGLGGEVIWLRARRDVERVMRALDLLVSSSSGEGFSNVLAEAMATEVPCVATDVGDACRILGDVGLVVPPRDPEALAGAILEILARKSRELGKKARERIVQKFSVARLVERTLEVIDEVWGKK